MYKTKNKTVVTTKCAAQFLNECAFYTRKKEEKKTNKNCNNCSTKDLVITLLIFLRRKTLFFFINRSGGGNSSFTRCVFVQQQINDHQGTRFIEKKKKQKKHSNTYIHKTHTLAKMTYYGMRSSLVNQKKKKIHKTNEETAELAKRKG